MKANLRFPALIMAGLLVSLLVLAGTATNMQKADAARPSWTASGGGSGVVDCARKVTGTLVAENLVFTAIKSANGGISGTWQIDSVWYSSTGWANGFDYYTSTMGGTISSGNINGARYHLNGSITTDQTCVGQLPANISIIGECGGSPTGPQVQIDYRSNNGQKGSYFGVVECSRI